MWDKFFVICTEDRMSISGCPQICLQRSVGDTFNIDLC